MPQRAREPTLCLEPDLVEGLEDGVPVDIRVEIRNAPVGVLDKEPPLTEAVRVQRVERVACSE